LDGKIISNFRELQNIFENFERINPIMLELLHYTQDVVKTNNGSGLLNYFEFKDRSVNVSAPNISIGKAKIRNLNDEDLIME